MSLKTHTKKMNSKVAHNRPNFFFLYCQLAQKQPKSQFLFQKNCSPRDLCIITLVTYIRMYSSNFHHLQQKPHFRAGGTRGARRLIAPTYLGRFRSKTLEPVRSNCPPWIFRASDVSKSFLLQSSWWTMKCI